MIGQQGGSALHQSQTGGGENVHLCPVLEEQARHLRTAQRQIERRPPAVALGVVIDVGPGFEQRLGRLPVPPLDGDVQRRRFPAPARMRAVSVHQRGVFRQHRPNCG
jgi:hypothetical protein